MQTNSITRQNQFNKPQKGRKRIKNYFYNSFLSRYEVIDSNMSKSIPG